ncbi:hypothetical protein ACFRQM_26880 [Streptomyces sp. NPDC056831]|uniref:hypothetical protein n=1 Tax=Streptomyces sp. NPDC056831 TaxID=3345954 RepID=UPI0036CE977F
MSACLLDEAAEVPRVDVGTPLRMEAGEEPIRPARNRPCALSTTITTVMGALGHTGPYQSHRMLTQAVHAHRARASSGTALMWESKRARQIVALLNLPEHAVTRLSREAWGHLGGCGRVVQARLVRRAVQRGLIPLRTPHRPRPWRCDPRRPAAPAASGHLRDARERLFTLPKVDYHRSDTWPARIAKALEQAAVRHRSAAHAAMGGL